MYGPTFDSLLARVGVRLAWAKAHTCPCTYQGLDGSGYGLDGTGREDCRTCQGLGVYWDGFTPPFMGLVGYGGFLPMPAEPGFRMDEKWGQVANAQPLITVPYSGAPIVWAQASTFDQIVEVDTPTRYSAVLKVGVQESLPYVNGCQVAPTGAVTLWSQSAVVSVPYTVSGTTVTLSGYATGTPYVVEFYADQTFVIFRRSGGLPHVRPFGGGFTNFPRRFTADTFDLWLRQRTGNANPPNWNANTGGQVYPLESGNASPNINGALDFSPDFIRDFT